MPDAPVQKSPRLIRRGDVVRLKAGERDEVVREVMIVLRLANGIDDSYSVDELVTMGSDKDLSPGEFVAAVKADAEDRAAAAREAEAADTAIAKS